ncbi:MAG: dTMP kinase [Sphingomonadaceae bacterium]
MFIALEGGEGAGKSTQARLLKDRLEAQGRAVLLTREPGGTPGAEAIRALFVSGAPDRWTAETDTLLIAAARADHVARAIRPALAGGQVVLCDRYIHSTLAYQGHGKGLDPGAIRAIHDFATGDLWPDLVLWIDLPPEEGLRRACARNGQPDRFEAHEAAFHARVRAGFAALAAEDPRIVRIDGTPGPEAVAEAVWAAVRPRLRTAP